MKHNPYSYTKVNMYASCPQKFKFRYIEKRKTPVTIPLVLGSVYHKFAELLDEYRQKKKDGSPLRDREIRTQLIDKANVGARLILPPDDKILLTELAIRYASKPINLSTLLGISKKFAFKEDYSECDYWDKDCLFRGEFDLLFADGGVGRIRDHKTSKEISTNPFQLECYAWAGSVLFPHITLWNCEFDFIRHNHIEPLSIDSNRVINIRNKILGIILRCENDKDFKGTESDEACRWCAYYRICPEKLKQGLDLKYLVPTSQQELDAIVLELSDKERRTKEIRGVLRDYLNINGEFKAGGYSFNYNTTQDWTGVQLLDLLLELKKQKLSWWEYFKIDWSAVRELVSVNSKMESLLDKMGTRRIKQTFSKRRAK